jgi:hypothetical protein
VSGRLHGGVRLDDGRSAHRSCVVDEDVHLTVGRDGRSNQLFTIRDAAHVARPALTCTRMTSGSTSGRDAPYLPHADLQNQVVIDALGRPRSPAPSAAIT